MRCWIRLDSKLPMCRGDWRQKRPKARPQLMKRGSRHLETVLLAKETSPNIEIHTRTYITQARYQTRHAPRLAPIRLSFCLSVYLSVLLHLAWLTSVYRSVCLSTSLYFYIWNCENVCPLSRHARLILLLHYDYIYYYHIYARHTSVHRSVCPSIYLSMFLSVCLCFC